MNYSLLEKKFVRVEPIRFVRQMIQSKDATIKFVSNVGIRVLLGEETGTVLDESIQNTTQATIVVV